MIFLRIRWRAMARRRTRSCACPAPSPRTGKRSRRSRRCGAHSAGGELSCALSRRWRVLILFHSAGRACAIRTKCSASADVEAPCPSLDPMPHPPLGTPAAWWRTSAPTRPPSRPSPQASWLQPQPRQAAAVAVAGSTLSRRRSCRRRGPRRVTSTRASQGIQLGFLQEKH